MTTPVDEETLVLENSLRTWIRSCGSVAVGFSGGIDSSLLCAVAVAELGPRAVAITVDSPMLPRSEIADARALADRLGIRHEIIPEEGIEPIVALNHANRCYHCKKIEFGGIRRLAASLGLEVVVDGSNLDDLKDTRPGAKAMRELGVKSPLKEIGFTKRDIRALARRLGLPNWDKPAFACLASRIPYGDPIDVTKLRQIEEAEEFLRSRGFRQYRVRAHQTIARLEIGRDERARFFDEAFLDEVSQKIKSLGFSYVAFELEGYAMGNLNRS